jgi:hypothetical protein
MKSLECQFSRTSITLNQQHLLAEESTTMISLIPARMVPKSLSSLRMESVITVADMSTKEECSFMEKTVTVTTRATSIGQQIILEEMNWISLRSGKSSNKWKSFVLDLSAA